MSVVIPRIPRNSLRFEVTRGAEIPDRTFTWLDESTGLPISFTTQPHTFELRIDTTPLVVKNTGIFGNDGDPNILFTFVQGEFDGLQAGHYHAQLWAKRTSDGKDREPVDFRFVVEDMIGLGSPLESNIAGQDVFLSSPVISGGVAIGGSIRKVHSIQIPWNYTQSVDPIDPAVGTALRVDANVTLTGGGVWGPQFNYAGGFGPAGIIDIHGLIRYGSDQSALAPGPISFADLSTMANTAGAARALRPGLPYMAARSIIADGATVTLVHPGDVPGAGVPAFVDSVIHGTVDGGTLDGLTNNYVTESFLSMPGIAGNTSIHKRIGFHVLAAYEGIHPLITEPTGPHWSGVGNFDPTTPTLQQEVGLQIDRFTLGATKIGIKSQHLIKLYDEAASLDALDFNVIRFGDASPPVLSANAANWSVGVVSASVVIEASENSNVFGAGALFNSVMIFKNANAQVQSIAAVHGVSIATRIRGDGAALTASDHFAYADRLTLDRINAGSVTADEITSLLSVPTVDVGATANIRRAAHVLDVGGAGTVTTNIGVDIDALARGTTNIGIRNASTEVDTPQLQALVAATQITPTARLKRITATGPITLSANPIIADGQDGQRLTLLNSSANAITFTTTTQGLRLGAATRVLGQYDTLELVYSTDTGEWSEISYANNS